MESGYYDKLWREGVIETPFYKTVNERYNDVYVGVTRQAAKQSKNTIVRRLTSLHRGFLTLPSSSRRL